MTGAVRLYTYLKVDVNDSLDMTLKKVTTDVTHRNQNKNIPDKFSRHIHKVPDVVAVGRRCSE